MTSLTREVAALVIEAGSATVDELMPELAQSPEFHAVTRAQAITALRNAAFNGLIACDGLNMAKGRKGKGALPGVYRAKPEPPRARPPASVWEFAQRASA